MILAISTSGESLPYLWRCREAGEEVRIYLHSKRHRNNYDGILKDSEKIGLSRLKESINKAEAVYFDIVRENKGNPQDLELLKLFGLPADSKTVYGPIADKIKRHTKVIGTCGMTEEWEFNREKGFEIAKACGINVPEYEKFTNIKKGQEFLRQNPERLWWLKPYGHQDMSFTWGEKKPGMLIDYLEEVVLPQVGSDHFEFVLQEDVDGEMISCQARWNGKEWMPYIEYTVEDKRFLTGDLGRNVGSSNNFVWVNDKPEGCLLWDNFQKLAPIMKGCGVLTAIDFNIIVAKKDKKPYIIEMCPREGYDAFMCEMTLLDSSLPRFMTDDFDAQWYDGFAASCRISIAPYPEEGKEVESLLKKAAMGVRILNRLKDMPWFWAEDVRLNERGKLTCAGSDGILGVVCARGKTIQETADKVYENIKKLNATADLQYRTDLKDRTIHVLNAFKRWGIKVI